MGASAALARPAGLDTTERVHRQDGRWLRALLGKEESMNVKWRFSTRSFASAGAGATGLSLILTLASSGGAAPSDPGRTRVIPQAETRTPTRLTPRSRHPRVTPSCSGASGTGAFDSTSLFITNKSSGAAFGGSNLAAAGYTGVFEGSANTICDYNSVILGGNSDTIDSGAGNTPAGAAYSMIGAGTTNTVTNFDAFIGAGGGNTVTSDHSFIGAGSGNTVSSYESFDGAGDSNSISGFDSFLGAGIGNALSGTVSFLGGGHNNSVSGHLSFVGAGYGNLVSGPGSFIGAGGDLTATVPDNQVSGSDSFVGAGDSNSVSANEAFIGSGQGNAIAAVANDSVIAGGSLNTAGNTYAAVGGGRKNNATGGAAFVGGGSDNTAAGSYATVPGGYLNAADGIGSFAAGTLAKARTNGAFVWSDDSTSTELQSTKNFEFLARASGGFYLYSNATATLGVKLAPNSGTWASASDRNMKSNVMPLDDAAVLAKVAALPITEWSYRAEDGVRHVGPMAQDFYAAFRVGEDDRHITSIDEDGIALAAIKALRRENVALRAGMQSQHAELVALRDELRELEATLGSAPTR